MTGVTAVIGRIGTIVLVAGVVAVGLVVSLVSLVETVEVVAFIVVNNVVRSVVEALVVTSLDGLAVVGTVVVRLTTMGDVKGGVCRGGTVALVVPVVGDGPADVVFILPEVVLSTASVVLAAIYVVLAIEEDVGIVTLSSRVVVCGVYKVVSMVDGCETTSVVDDAVELTVDETISALDDEFTEVASVVELTILVVA